MSSLIVERVQRVIEEDRGILDTFGMTVVKALDGECVITCKVPPHLVNASGFAHGSIAHAMMDTGCAYALGSTETRGVTIQGDVKYVRGGQADSRLQATVNLVSRTRRVATLRGEVVLLDSGSPELAAHGSFVFALRED